jgi:hypothetical protein
VAMPIVTIQKLFMALPLHRPSERVCGQANICLENQDALIRVKLRNPVLRE